MAWEGGGPWSPGPWCFHWSLIPGPCFLILGPWSVVLWRLAFAPWPSDPLVVSYIFVLSDNTYINTNHSKSILQYMSKKPTGNSIYLSTASCIINSYLRSIINSSLRLSTYALQVGQLQHAPHLRAGHSAKQNRILTELLGGGHCWARPHILQTIILSTSGKPKSTKSARVRYSADMVGHALLQLNISTLSSLRLYMCADMITNCL